VLGLILFAAMALEARGSAFIRGAYYRLGEDDPGAAAGAVGNDPTRDSFTDKLDLSRVGSPHYSADTPAKYALSKLSMAFGQVTGGPTFLGYYSRATPLPTDQGYALEAWVSSFDSAVVDPPTVPELIAYNGTPGTDGFGFYQTDGKYVARIGATDQVLGAADNRVWHHLAYIQSFDNASFYYDGTLVNSTTGAPVPVAPTGGFWLGGRKLGANDADLFDGNIDEVRYQSYNPIAAGAFEPTAFLIDAPEPSAMGLVVVVIALGAMRRRR
jgi:hypothetical protein